MGGWQTGLVSRARLLATVALLASGLAACTTARPAQMPRGDAGELQMALQYWAEQYNRTPGDPRAAFAYSRALIASGQRAQAVAVLQRSLIANPNDRFLQGELGKAYASNGQFQEAIALFEQAHSPDRPDWRILSAHGAVMDQVGRPQDARRMYQQALTLAPGEPAVLSNLGMSHALTGELPTAEQHLRQAAASTRAEARVRQNLALVVGMQGRLGEAEQIARGPGSSPTAEQDVVALRQMLRQPSTQTARAQAPAVPQVAARTPTLLPGQAARAQAIATTAPSRPMPPAGNVATAPRR